MNPTPSKSPSPLSILPLSVLLRSLFVATVCSSPSLLTPALSILSSIANSKSSFLNPDRNPVLKYIVAKTVYAQFCAGESPAEVRQSVSGLKDLGYSGVILGYAKERVINEDEVFALGKDVEVEIEDEKRVQDDVAAWRDGTIATVNLTEEGDFVAVKFTGAGQKAVRQLVRGRRPFPNLEQAIVEICDRARDRGVRLLFDAEQQVVQPTIEEWTLEYSRRYNKSPNRRALIFGTYQAYLRSTSSTLAKHLAIAQSEGFVLGVKLVRGAYLGAEPRHLIWDTKDLTDKTYNNLAENLIKGKYGEALRPATKADLFPEVNLVLASHNRESVRRALDLREELIRQGHNQIEMAYAQLYGMADDISCQLILQGAQAQNIKKAKMEIPKAYKALVWGTVGECMRYLLRRGEENRDAALRTKETRAAMVKELKRRLWEWS
ncbi:proline dehydrogenase [Emydomyces testavorans]|uniref:Proline dehydrogenase n=1 Tax=Emydomyces testavorans TaxID=2070801 RepID=A0AAF0DHP9_9EURO|nr:proline dehydrogenase [Emydomyces testavorans]